MIRIEISGDTPAIIRAELQDLLRMYPSDLAEKFTVKVPVRAVESGPLPEPNFVLQPSGDVVEVAAVTGTDDAAALVYHDALRVGDQVPLRAASAPATQEVQDGAHPAKRGRGRPRRQPTSADTSADAPPAVALNTGSAPAGQLPPAEGVQAPGADVPLTSDAAATVAAVSAPAPSNAQMRAALQEMVEAVGDQNAGQLLAKEILAAFQYQKVGQVQEEHTAGIIEKAQGAMERLTAEPDKPSRLPIATAITTELAAARA